MDNSSEMDMEEDFSRRKMHRISRTKVCVSCRSPKELIKCKKGHAYCSGCATKLRPAADAGPTGSWPCPSADCKEFITLDDSASSTASIPATEGEATESLQPDVGYNSAESRGRVRIAHKKPMSATKGLPLLQGRDPADWLSSPAGWTGVTAERKFCSVNLELKSNEAQRVIATLGAVQARQVYRIENEWLWQQYSLKKKHMLRDKNMEDINETILFQGCTFEDVKEIGELGWLPHNISASKHGTGYHFNTGCYQRGERFPEVFVIAQVLCGTPTLGAPTYSLPPHRESGGRYGSCLDSETSPTTFVLFDQSQCYPGYAAILNDTV